ncbi:hypothetical protein VM1G_06130 [Cytospora mali]|uniref:E3 ubiquitin-protein ligase UBR1-like winged-helix domain-containing protein n=1 Tax=Cytospora mali TaxID=578113 RepID=A0A194W2H2_CYTMA|nr:hypothetical protein VM1G_06130 [Valsa mali]
MVLRIPETGLHLESSAKSADTLPLQAFALTINDNVIGDLIKCVQNGGEPKLSLGNTPSFLCNGEVHKITKASEIPNLDLYLTDPSDSIQEAERLPHPTMSLFMRPDFRRFPKLAAGRVVVKEKVVPTKATAPARKPQNDVSDDVAKLKEVMAQAKTDKMENATKIVNAPLAGVKRGTTKGNKAKLLPSAKGSTVTISRSGAASPALSGTGSPSLAPTLSSDELAKAKAKELRSPIVHELAVKEMSFEELRSRWPGEEKDFKTALDKVADFDSSLQKFIMKKMYWKELDVFNYEYDSDDERQKAIDNAIRMYDRMRMGTSEPQWQRLLPKEERGKGKCLSKLQQAIAKSSAQAKTPQIKVHDPDDSSGSKNGDDTQSGVDKKVKKGGEPMSRSSSQTKQPAKKLEKKLMSQKKASTPKVSPTRPAAKTSKAKGSQALSKEFKSKEFISASDESSSEEAPLSTTVARSKAIEKERGREKEKEREREREKEREKQKQAERAKEKEASVSALATRSKPKPAPKEIIKPQVVARPVVQKRQREDPDDDSSSGSSTPLHKRAGREIKAASASHSNLSYKRPPSDSSSQSSSRSNSYAAPSFPNKNKNTSPVKSSPLASSPPTNASDLDQHTTTDDSRPDRHRDRSRDRSVTVANGTINVKKRKADPDRDSIDMTMAEKKRQRLSTDLLDKARKFKSWYAVYQGLHHELSASNNFDEEKYSKLLDMHHRLEKLKGTIYSQIPEGI